MTSQNCLFHSDIQGLLSFIKNGKAWTPSYYFHGLPIPSKTSSTSNTVKRHSLSIPTRTQSIYFFKKEAVIKTVKSHDANPYSQQSSHCLCDENHDTMKFEGEIFWSGHNSEEQLSHKLVWYMHFYICSLSVFLGSPGSPHSLASQVLSTKLTLKSFLFSQFKNFLKYSKS